MFDRLVENGPLPNAFIATTAISIAGRNKQARCPPERPPLNCDVTSVVTPPPLTFVRSLPPPHLVHSAGATCGADIRLAAGSRPAVACDAQDIHGAHPGLRQGRQLEARRDTLSAPLSAAQRPCGPFGRFHPACSTRERPATRRDTPLTPGVASASRPLSPRRRCIEVFEMMEKSGIRPTKHTLSSLLVRARFAAAAACSSLWEKWKRGEDADAPLSTSFSSPQAACSKGGTAGSAAVVKLFDRLVDTLDADAIDLQARPAPHPCFVRLWRLGQCRHPTGSMMRRRQRLFRALRRAARALLPTSRCSRRSCPCSGACATRSARSGCTSGRAPRGWRSTPTSTAR